MDQRYNLCSFPFWTTRSYRSQNHQDKKKSTIQIPYSGSSTFTSMSSCSLCSFLHCGVSWKETAQIPHSGRLHIHIHVFFFLTLFLPIWWCFLKKNYPNPAFRKLHSHSHVFFFLLTLFLTTWWCFPEEKLSKSCILEGSTFTTMSSSFSLYSLLRGGNSSLGNLICVCVWGKAESSPATAEKNRTENEFLSWFLQEHCFWERPWESPTRVYFWCYDELEVGGFEEEDDALGVKSKRRLNLASCPTVSDCFPGSRT